MAGVSAQATAGSLPAAIPVQAPVIDRAAVTAVRPIIAATALGRSFEAAGGPVDAIRDVNLQIEPGEFKVIVGPSGCGKTTLLRIIAGLETHTAGTLEMHGANGRPPSNAMVFQGRSVFPWLKVNENVAYGLKLAGVTRRHRGGRAKELLALVGLSRFANAYPHQLSEGMRQRVAIARALAVDPDLLLMDEPFGALDEQTRFILQEELLKIWEQTRKTVVFVTHSIDEALTMADRIVVMSAHPGTILREFEVPFARPRELTAVRSDPHFAELFSSIWELLRQEVQRARAQQHGAVS